MQSTDRTWIPLLKYLLAGSIKIICGAMQRYKPPVYRWFFIIRAIFV